jgi:hypothetical protein
MRSWNKRGVELRFLFLGAGKRGRGLTTEFAEGTEGETEKQERSFGFAQDDLKAPETGVFKSKALRRGSSEGVNLIGAAQAKRRLLMQAEWPPVSAR